MDNNYLVHHGVLGMKWGVRRYQNEDGSLTSRGMKRYGSKEALQAHITYKANKRKGIGVQNQVRAFESKKAYKRQMAKARENRIQAKGSYGSRAVKAGAIFVAGSLVKIGATALATKSALKGDAKGAAVSAFIGNYAGATLQGIGIGKGVSTALDARYMSKKARIEAGTL